jgi:two-component system, OmpR family, sensor histidine kinase QseC
MIGWPRSLQGRLLALVLGAVALTWIAAAALTAADARHELDELLDGHLAQAAALLVVQQTRAEDDDDHAVDAPQLHRYAPQVAFQVWHEGRLSMRSSNAPQQAMHPAGLRFTEGLRTVTIDGKPWRVFATHGAERDVQVYVGEQLSSREAILRAVLRGLGVTLLLALPLLALAAWWAVQSGTAPLRRLGQQLAQRQPQALQPVDLPQAPTELKPLLDALNGLFGRIGGLLESERRFTADAAHELRTPIAAIRTQAQVAMGETDDALRLHALQATLDGCDRATRLVEQLLTLARLESNATLDRQPVDLSALARQLAAEVAPRALQKRQQLSVDATALAVVPGNEILLAVLLRNLLDNAVRYSPPGAAVQLTVQTDGGAARLSVEDGGPGLSAADLARLGERFFRVPGHDAPGSGLGWSIVRRIAAAQGVQVELSASASLGGLAVRLVWPAA